jgi:hypothetical protein
MFVVKTLVAEPVYRAFAALPAAQRWAEGAAYLEHQAEQCQIYRTVGGLTRDQAIAAVRIGKAERLLTVSRRVGVDGSQDRR